jgi:chemotaxis protein methyltransferase CheR
MTDEEYTLLKTRIIKLIDIDLNCYKSQQMRRRLSFYIERANNMNIHSYCQLLEQDKTHQSKLRDFLTINVTEFFRDEWAFKELKTNILPDLVSKNRLKIWSAGCADGGEPYSIAILLKELSVQYIPIILATDIDEMSLLKASSGGPYTSDSIKNIPKDLLSKYFSFTDNKYWLKDSIKGMVRFKRHNLLLDTFERGFDLICCRNVTIYFTQETKTRLNQRFANSLNEDGILFIGATEFMMNPQDTGLIKLGSCFYKRMKASVPVNPYEEPAVLQKM